MSSVVVDHLHLVHRLHGRCNRQQFVVGKSQKEHDVGVDEVPLVQDGVPAALGDVDRAPVVAHGHRRPAWQVRRPMPVLEDDSLPSQPLDRRTRAASRAAMRRRMWLVPLADRRERVRCRSRGSGSARHGCCRSPCRRRQACRRVTVRRTRAPLCSARYSGRDGLERSVRLAAHPQRELFVAGSGLPDELSVRPRGSAGTAAHSATHGSPRRAAGPGRARVEKRCVAASCSSIQARASGSSRVRATRRGQESTRPWNQNPLSGSRRAGLTTPPCRVEESFRLLPSKAHGLSVGPPVTSTHAAVGAIVRTSGRADVRPNP